MGGLILPNGDINWNCPCLGGMAVGPCGVEFREAFSCFHYSESEPKGTDCIEKFGEMQKCMQGYPELFEESKKDKSEKATDKSVEAPDKSVEAPDKSVEAPEKSEEVPQEPIVSSPSEDVPLPTKDTVEKAPRDLHETETVDVK